MSAVRPDVFFTYRNDWWEWIVSVMIADKIGYYHYNTFPTSINSLILTEDDIANASNRAAAVWNEVCQLRLKNPSLNFYIIEFSDLIKNTHLSGHAKIKYDKRELVSNYEEVKEIFYSGYLGTLVSYEQRCISHLHAMKCQFIAALK